MRGLRPRSPSTITAVRIDVCYLLLGLSSAVLALLLTPVIGRGSTRLGLVDAPGGRKVHMRSVPRLGGLAVVLAAGLALLLVSMLQPALVDPADWTPMRPFFIAGGLIFAIGFVDDLRGRRSGPEIAVRVRGGGDRDVVGAPD